MLHLIIHILNYFQAAQSARKTHSGVHLSIATYMHRIACVYSPGGAVRRINLAVERHGSKIYNSAMFEEFDVC